MPSLVRVHDLNVAVNGTAVLSGVSFDLEPGSITGLFGESGCGKTTLAQAMLNLLPCPPYRLDGAVEFEQRNLLTLNERGLQSIRGARISLMMQDPLLALNPVLRAYTQVREVARAHQVLDPRMPDVRNAYAHQLSGGERQRVTLAQALVCDPSLVIADEPFTALDAARVAELAESFRERRRTKRTAFLIVAHDPALLQSLADTVLVMYAGRIVERGTPRQVFEDPRHPYTRGLIQCLQPRGSNGRLYAMPGNPPGLADRPRGCAFEPRCADRMDTCAAAVPLEITLSGSRSVRCVLYEC